ncbi:MAG: alpha/beta hydrolase [Marinobacter sp.]|nr:alpha/beta hydrolase [Marinobacter sp.]
MNTRHVLLADGRHLAYAQYGPSNGKAVIAFHCIPGSRLELIGDATLLAELNIRLIVVDRPGYGRSDFLPGRRLLDWPDDVSQLADALHLDRFSILGFSGGGAHAAACAVRIPQRLNRVALIGSTAPFDAPGVLAGMLPQNRALFELAVADYQQLEQQLAPVATTAEAVLGLLEAPAPAADRAIFAGEPFRSRYLENLAEAIRQGLTGFAYDMSLIARPWGFDPADIDVPVSLWHGEDDLNAPLAMGRYLADTIPRCQADFMPGEGHWLMFAHSRAILQRLTAGQ